MRRLLLCRHAKSSWKDLSLDDIDRPLNKRGKQNAPEMGRRLAAKGLRPDIIVSSPAKRALKTARRLAGEVGFKKNKIRIIEDVYGAAADELLEIIRGFDKGIELALIVGHNPETTVLANILGNFDIDNVPTCGIVFLEFAVDSWAKVKKGEGTLVFFDYPRKGK